MCQLCARLRFRYKLLQYLQTFLGSISPQDGTQSLDRLLPPAVISAETDVPDMGPQLLYDLFHILQLLRGKECIVQKPVIGLLVLVLIPEQFDGTVKQLYHPVAALYALGMVLNITPDKVHPHQVHRF